MAIPINDLRDAGLLDKIFALASQGTKRKYNQKYGGENELQTGQKHLEDVIDSLGPEGLMVITFGGNDSD
jgi:hypothetical protein